VREDLPSTADPGSMRTTGVPAWRRRCTSRSSLRRACHRIGASVGRVPRRADIGDTTTTRSTSARRSTSALVGEWTPPSKYETPSTCTGAK
jgi:hypothetical protein